MVKLIRDFDKSNRLTVRGLALDFDLDNFLTAFSP
jgi:hypothetical protein